MPTRQEALDFLEDSRQPGPIRGEAERVEDFRRKNLRLKLVPPDDDLLAILRVVDLLAEALAALPADAPFPVRES